MAVAQGAGLEVLLPHLLFLGCHREESSQAGLPGADSTGRKQCHSNEWMSVRSGAQGQVMPRPQPVTGVWPGLSHSPLPLPSLASAQSTHSSPCT